MASLLLVGHGKMGSALLKRWQENSPAGIKKFFVIDAKRAPRSSKRIASFKTLDALPKNTAPDIIVFAIKPQQMATALPAYASRFGAKPLYLSIAAGKPLAWLASVLGSKAKIVRAMPNLPATIGHGMTVLCATRQTRITDRRVATQLMQAIGHAEWIGNELWMDGVTAISGSGPAYLFYFMEALTDAALQYGIPRKLALALVRHTVTGSALLAEKFPFDDLRKQVTSPGGTTEAALSVLSKEQRFYTLIHQAVQAAAERSVALQSKDKS